jgi:phage terminase large subunit GpA-like protein
MSATRLTAFIDVHASVLYYCVAAWEENFSGYILDYGTYPDQKRPYFTLNDAKYTLESVTKIAGLEGQIYAGLETLTAALIGHEWKRDDGATMRIERCMIDGNWGPQTDLIYQFCRQSAFASVIMPSHGRGIKSSDRPMREWVKKPGDRVGLNWRIPGTQGKRALRKVMFDTNYWKTFLHTRLNVAMGNAGCLSLFGDKPDIHRMFADHIVAEYPVPTRREGSNRVVDEWKWPLTRPDNHFLDTAVGCAVAASMQGVSLPETTIAAPPKKHRVTFADLRARQSGQRPPS